MQSQPLRWRHLVLTIITMIGLTSNSLHAAWWSEWTASCQECYQTTTDACRQWRGAWRACAEAWPFKGRQPDYGLRLLPDDRAVAKTQPTVIFVHGFNSRPEDLSSLIQLATSSGHRCATFRYPNDQPIRVSAELLARDLLQHAKQHPRGPVIIVAHSMGGLVARAVIENPELCPENVTRLIMVATPNHGTRLARLSCSMDVVEYLSSETRRQEAGPFYGSILDGLSEATDDLEPDSAFLKKLNQRPRNSRVQYTNVLGTRGPLQADDFENWTRVVAAAGRRCSWMRCLDRNVVTPFVHAEELFEGTGDGVVSVASGQLNGVDDVIVARFDHNEIFDSDPSPVVRVVRDEILLRICQD